MIPGEQVAARFSERQPLWVLVGPERTLLCARHATAGLVLLSWTTREELDAGVRALADHAPILFESHTPQQRTFRSLLETASFLGMGLRIDDYAVEDLEEVRN